MPTLAIIGAQWGDEGKGKITDALTAKADVVVRFQGGNNAGHTIQFGQKKYAFHLLPSGSLHPEKVNVLANGMVIDPLALLSEFRLLDREAISTKNILVSNRAHVVMPFHRDLDAFEEHQKLNRIGTTLKGIGPTYQDKIGRRGLRMVDFLNDGRFRRYLKETLPYVHRVLGDYLAKPYNENELFERMSGARQRLAQHIADTSLFLNQALEEGKKILFEGAQGTMLCLDHGTYPYVTSSSPTAASIPLGVGMAPKHINRVLAITKAYSTRVGEGPMVSQIEGALEAHIRDVGHEFGTTTGRARRIGYFDAVALRHAHRINGFSHLAITLLDVLTGIHPLKIVVGYRHQGELLDAFPASTDVLEACEMVTIELPGFDEDISKVTTYEALPENAKAYVEKISALSNIPLGIVSVGPDRAQTLYLEDNLFEG